MRSEGVGSAPLSVPLVLCWKAGGVVVPVCAVPIIVASLASAEDSRSNCNLIRNIKTTQKEHQKKQKEGETKAEGDIILFKMATFQSENKERKKGKKKRKSCSTNVTGKEIRSSCLILSHCCNQSGPAGKLP